MITAIRANRHGYTNMTEFNPGFVHESDVLLKSVEGLDPVKANLALTGYAFAHGSYFHRSRYPDRNIVMTFDHVSYGSKVSDSKQWLYMQFIVGHRVYLEIENHAGLVVRIDGIVENVDSSTFTKTPQSQVSIVCESPLFVGPYTVDNTDNYSSQAPSSRRVPVHNVGNAPMPLEWVLDRLIPGPIGNPGNMPQSFGVRLSNSPTPGSGSSIAVANLSFTGYATRYNQPSPPLLWDQYNVHFSSTERNKKYQAEHRTLDRIRSLQFRSISQQLRSLESFYDGWVVPPGESYGVGMTWLSWVGETNPARWGLNVEVRYAPRYVGIS